MNSFEDHTEFLATASYQFHTLDPLEMWQDFLYWRDAQQFQWQQSLVPILNFKLRPHSFGLRISFHRVTLTVNIEYPHSQYSIRWLIKCSNLLSHWQLWFNPKNQSQTTIDNLKSLLHKQMAVRNEHYHTWSPERFCAVMADWMGNSEIKIAIWKQRRFPLWASI
jgi:hypothetical protein